MKDIIKKSRRKKLSLTDSLCEYGSFLKYSSGSENTSKSEKRKRMEAFLRIAIKNELTERQRTCIYRYYFDRMHVEDIAAMMGLKPTTVYKHIRLARKALKKCSVYL